MLQKTVGLPGRSKSGIRHIEPLLSIKNHGASNRYTGPHPNLQKVHTTTNGPVLRSASARFAELAIQESQHSGSLAVKPRRVPVTQSRKVHPRHIVACRLVNMSVSVRSISVVITIQMKYYMLPMASRKRTHPNKCSIHARQYHETVCASICRTVAELLPKPTDRHSRGPSSRSCCRKLYPEESLHPIPPTTGPALPCNCTASNFEAKDLLDVL